MSFLNINQSLEALKYWSGGNFAPSTSNIAGYLMHHCVLEIEFRRKYKSRMVIGNRGGIRREYRDRTHRNGDGAPYVADWWYGRKRRVMLCTLDMTLLRSLLGREVLNYREPTGVGTPMSSNIIQVWDIIWQDFRAVDLSTPVTVRAVIPTSVLPTDKPLGTTEESKKAIYQQQEIFRQLLEANFRNMSWRKKFAYMDGDVNLQLQLQESQLRKNISDKNDKEKQEEEEKENLRKKLEDEVNRKNKINVMKKELELMNIETQKDKMRGMIKEMRELSRGMSTEDEKRFIEELRTFGKNVGFDDLRELDV